MNPILRTALVILTALSSRRGAWAAQSLDAQRAAEKEVFDRFKAKLDQKLISTDQVTELPHQAGYTTAFEQLNGTYQFKVSDSATGNEMWISYGVTKSPRR